MAPPEEAGGGDQFPVGMKVLVVDDDPTCLAVLNRMLVQCHYDATTCSQATVALSMLRENRGGFDVIISSVHMPDMDGFRLLELVGLELDLPVIMMSADSSTNAVMKGIKHGACDYLIKPVRMEELKNIWQHVVRKKFSGNKEHEHSGSLDDTDRTRPTNNDNEYASSANDVADDSWKSQKKKRDKDDDDSELESGDPSNNSKKPRVVCSVELHRQFVNAVNHLGIDKAVPKKILELMNVPGLTRENVASHLQKFRLYLKRIAQHHAGMANPYGAPASSAQMASLGGLDFQTLAASGQIPPQALAALHDELLGRPTPSLVLPARDQSSLRLAAIKGNKPHGEREIAFGQPLYKCQNNSYGAFPQSSPGAGRMPSFSGWPNNKLGMQDSTSTLGNVNNSQNSNIVLHELQQQPDTMLSGTLHTLDVKPSGGDQFPVGMKVLVVDDDPTCLAVLNRMLVQCRYDATTCSRATVALSMLRENRGGFDVIISDVHMPDMDGFRLLELVGLELDLPVIMMSADSTTNAVMKGIKHGACDYLIKPVRMEELKNIWQHVVRKKFSGNKEHEHSGSLDDTDRTRPTNNDNEYASSANDGAGDSWKSQKKKRYKDDHDSELESGDPSNNSKKPRVVWSVELHQQFVNAVNHLGIDKAVPKKILELMNVPGLTRESVASHLQCTAWRAWRTLKNMICWLMKLLVPRKKADIDKFRKELPALIVDSLLNEEP